MRITTTAKVGVLAAGFGLFLGALPARAHHAFAAEYDSNKVVKISGTVTKVEWMNPHSRFYVDVKEDNGTVTNWNFTIGSPNNLFRAGWTRNTIRAGDQVKVEGFAAKDGSHLAQTRNVTLADGRTVPGFGGAADSGGAPTQ